MIPQSKINEDTTLLNLTRQCLRNRILAPLSAISLLLLTACGGSDDPNITTDTGGSTNTGPTVSLLASPDTVSTQMDSAIIIPVLANDKGVSESAKLSIEVVPSNGSASVMANNTINYKPATSFTGKESFSYKVSLDGRSAIATVTVNVACSTCSKDVNVSLSWQATNNGDDIGYLIYYGPDSNNINSLAFDLSPSTGLDANAPAIIFSAKNDLQLNPGDSVCFQISAYSSTAQSNFSAPVCGSL